MTLQLNRAAKNRSGLIAPRAAADHGPIERWRHSGRTLEPTERAGVLAARALEESVLDVLVLRGAIEENQREAALRLRLDFQRAGLQARLSFSYNPARRQFSPFGPWDERTDAEEAAYQRWRNALRAVGKRHNDAVVTAACFDIAPAPERMDALREGLKKLAKWYGMEDDE